MYIAIGKIVNTHGIKGELRLLSKFKYKEKVFKKNMSIYIGKKKEQEFINTYRKHKNFDMITLKNYDNINQVLKYKDLNVYVKGEDLNLNSNEYLDEDLINLAVYNNDKIIGTIIKVENITDKNKILIILVDEREVMIPFVEEFVTVDIKNHLVKVNLIEGMI